MENQELTMTNVPNQSGQESSRQQFPDVNSNEGTLAHDLQNLGTHNSSPSDQFQVKNSSDPLTSYSFEKPAEAQGSPNNNGNLPDPKTRQAYANALPPAGLPLRHVIEKSSPNKKYNMASDIFGTGMDTSWSSAGPPPKPRDIQAPARTPQNSFKITERQTVGGEIEGYLDDSSQNTAGRRARESLGNPLTGQGYTDSSTKTAKRYFEGSNANQKLW